VQARLARRLCLAAGLAVATATAAQAPAGTRGADTILVGGTVLRFDAPAAQALAVRGERILAVGSDAEMRALAGPRTRVIALGGRTVIPGLIDSHIHAIRAGLTWNTEVHWHGARTLKEALRRLRAGAARVPRGGWLVVAGGWTEAQFAERRRPTRAEIAAAAPHHKVYVQQMYSAALFSPGAMEAAGLTARPELASRLTFELDADGSPSGWVSADSRSISELFDLLPRPDMATRMAGTRAFFRRLNSLGITGVLDPGGYNMPVADYEALFRLWRARALTVRVAYSVSAPRRDHELEDFRHLAALLPMGMGDDWLRFNGIGENVTWGMYNNDRPGAAQKAQLAETLHWAAARGLGATFHWNNDTSVGHLLEVIEEVDATAPVAPLRWSIAHLNDASPGTLSRMRALGLGWLMQNALYYRAPEFISRRGIEAARAAPPIGQALRLGLPVGGGTDAHRVMHYHPFVSLQWMVDGRSVGGVHTRAAAETPTRLEALRLYTQGSAWFSHDEARRGALEPGMLADLAVLDRDFMDVPVERVGATRSLLTMVGGRVVHAVKGFRREMAIP
jgi:predicted amidohydrolase YtcJ